MTFLHSIVPPQAAWQDLRGVEAMQAAPFRTGSMAVYPGSPRRAPNGKPGNEP